MHGPGVPALALDLELRLVRLVAEQLELLEARLEPQLAERVGDRRPPRASAASLPAVRGPTPTAERVDQVHAASLVPS